MFKRLWDQAEMHATLETDDNFEIVASTIKAIYDQTCRSCGLINRMIMYMPKDGKRVRQLRIDHKARDTPAKQKWLRPDKRESEEQGPVSDKRQKDDATRHPLPTLVHCGNPSTGPPRLLAPGVGRTNHGRQPGALGQANSFS